MMEESAAEKDSILQKKIKTIGNYVHDSVPISKNEVSPLVLIFSDRFTETKLGQQCHDPEMGTRGSQS